MAAEYALEATTHVDAIYFDLCIAWCCDFIFKLASLIARCQSSESHECFMNSCLAVQVSEQLLSAFGVNTVGDLQQKCCMVSYLFSPISFDYFLHVSLGLGSTKHFAQEDDERKSVSCERTFAGTGSKQEMEAKIQDMSDRLHSELSELKLTGRCVTLKLKQVDFRVRPGLLLECHVRSIDCVWNTGVLLDRIVVRRSSEHAYASFCHGYCAVLHSGCRGAGVARRLSLLCCCRRSRGLSRCRRSSTLPKV